MALTDEQVASLLKLPTQSIHDKVMNKVIECRDRLNEKLPKHGVDQEITVPTVKYDLVGTTAGKASRSNVMHLNLAALNDPNTRDYMLNQMIPHKMAQIAEFQLYGDAGHGFRWSHLCRLLEIQPHRTHNLPLKRARKTTKFKYRCNCSVHWVGKNRHSKIQINSQYLLHCRSCGGKLIYSGEQMERS